MKRFSRLLYFIAAISCLFSGCASQEGQEYEECTVHIKVNLDKPSSKEIKISEYVRDVQFIPISWDSEFWPTGRIIRYCRGFYYLMDGNTQSIVKVSEEGEVVCRIGSQGRAANEYLSVTSFDVNPSTSEVFVYEIERNRMVVYSGNGEYLRSFSLESTNGLFRDFVVFPNGNIIGCDMFYEGPSVLRGVWMVDSEGGFLKQVVSVNKRSRFDVGIALPLLTKIGEDTVCIMGPVGDDSIYKIDSDGDVVTRYLFDFGSQITPKDLCREVSLPLLGYFFCKASLIVSPSFFRIGGDKDGMPFRVYYDFLKDKCYVQSKNTSFIFVDVPDFRGGEMVDGYRLMTFCDAEHLPSDIPNPDSTALWMVVTHLK